MTTNLLRGNEGERKVTEFNFVIVNQHFCSSDVELFFDDEKVEYIKCPIDSGIGDRPIDMYDILVKVGIFKSKSIARKNWNRTGPQIPKGFSDFKGIGKLKRRITILNPCTNWTE